MRLSLAELDSIWKTLMRHLAERGVDTIDISDIDEYWTILAPECYEFKREPSNSVGSLSSDWSTLQRLKDEEEVSATADLDRFAAVLKAISAKLAPPM
ncbi:MAG: hypothetical protein HUU21_13370 [Polyangiaceae bacterium]|nr:hypothetical protein [Polyangiaceae bacterium]